MAVLITFHEVLLDPDIIGGPASLSPLSGFPEFKNEHLLNDRTGVVKTNVGNLDGIEKLTLDIRLLSPEARRYFLNFYRGGYGSAIGFRTRVPYDYRVEEEAFATSNGVLTEFKLYVTYKRPGITSHADVRRITKPVVPIAKETNSFQLLDPDGVNNRTIDTPFKIYLNTGTGNVEITTGWTVNAKTGVVTFAVAPAAGTLSWTGEFDIPAAFLPVAPKQVFDVNSEVTGIFLREILHSELGIAY